MVPDQALNKSVRTGRAGNGLDLIDLKYAKVGKRAMEAEQRIVI
jgi:hypothetical protein